MVRPIDANALIDKLESINPVDYGAMSSYETHNGARDALSDAVRYVNDAPDISLNTLRDEIYEDAVAHGLWDADMTYPLDDLCELINDELKELAEAADDYEYKSGTMDRFCEELADMVIMSMSVAGLHGIDIDAAIKRKMEINQRRPWKHRKE